MSHEYLPRPLFSPRTIRLATRITLCVSSLMASLVILLYGLSEWQLRRTYEAPLLALRVPVEAARAGEGERLAHAFGCAGCHRAAGHVLAEMPGVVHLVAPNLSRVARSYSNAELVRVIRHGVKRDGTSTIEMPAAILAGKVPFSAATVRALPPPLVRPTATPSDHGEYLVKAVCSHCHELDAEHDNGWGVVAPALRMMGQAYPLQDFRHLLRTGRAMGNRDLGLMSAIAREDLSHMTDPEIEAIHAFLNDLEKAPADVE